MPATCFLTDDQVVVEQARELFEEHAGRPWCSMPPTAPSARTSKRFLEDISSPDVYRNVIRHLTGEAWEGWI